MAARLRQVRYLTQLRKFDYDEPYDTNEIQGAFIGLLNALGPGRPRRPRALRVRRRTPHVVAVVCGGCLWWLCTGEMHTRLPSADPGKHSHTTLGPRQLAEDAGEAPPAAESPGILRSPRSGSPHRKVRLARPPTFRGCAMRAVCLM